MSNLVKRSLSGIVYVLVMIGGILCGSITFCVLFILVTALSVREFHQLTAEHQLATVNSFGAIISGAYLFYATYNFMGGNAGAVIFLPYLLSILFLFVNELYQKQPSPIANWAYTFLGQIYVVLPLALLNLLAFANGEYSPVLPLAVFIFIWLNDTGAYCFGSLLHKKIPYKLFERISPNKSWVGSIGGGITVLVAAVIFSQYCDELTLMEWCGLGLTIVIFGTWGDLVESLFKRQLKIKDSGNFMPGHGGVLDRFDSALLAIPACVVYVYAITSFS